MNTGPYTSPFHSQDASNESNKRALKIVFFGKMTAVFFFFFFFCSATGRILINYSLRWSEMVAFLLQILNDTKKKFAFVILETEKRTLVCT